MSTSRANSEARSADHQVTAAVVDRSQKAYARFAGMMYFFTVFDFTGVAIVSRLTGNGTFLEAAHSIAAAETLYRIALVCGVVGNLSTILLAIALYVTLKPVNVNLAMTALLFRLAESAIGAVVVALGFATLQIYLDLTYFRRRHRHQRDFLLCGLDDLLLSVSQVGLHPAAPCDLGTAWFATLHVRLCREPSRSAILGCAARHRRPADRGRRARSGTVALDQGG
ncbi:MAG: DUF4386 family protein [Chloroflexi bacterium]|nr:MAG: DUF4386 family protein [Chloroflexota bacterium]